MIQAKVLNSAREHLVSFFSIGPYITRPLVLNDPPVGWHPDDSGIGEAVIGA